MHSAGAGKRCGPVSDAEPHTWQQRRDPQRYAVKAHKARRCASAPGQADRAGNSQQQGEGSTWGVYKITCSSWASPVPRSASAPALVTQL